MNFKKYLRIDKHRTIFFRTNGQSAIEYFLLLGVIVAATVISQQFFWPQIRDSLQGGFFPQVVSRIETADQR